MAWSVVEALVVLHFWTTKQTFLDDHEVWRNCKCLGCWGVHGYGPAHIRWVERRKYERGRTLSCVRRPRTESVLWISSQKQMILQNQCCPCHHISLVRRFDVQTYPMLMERSIIKNDGPNVRFWERIYEGVCVCVPGRVRVCMRIRWCNSTPASISDCVTKWECRDACMMRSVCFCYAFVSRWPRSAIGRALRAVDFHAHPASRACPNRLLPSPTSEYCALRGFYNYYKKDQARQVKI